MLDLLRKTPGGEFHDEYENELLRHEFLPRVDFFNSDDIRVTVDHLVDNKFVLDFVEYALVVCLDVLDGVNLPLAKMLLADHAVHLEDVAESTTANEYWLFSTVHVFKKLLSGWVVRLI